MDKEVLKTWKTPYPEADITIVRPKEYQMVRLADGRVAFCKTDSISQYLDLETDALLALDGLDCVPQVIHRSPLELFTTLVPGTLLPNAIAPLSVWDCIKISWEILLITRRIHTKGVIHGDIMLWNFILGPGNRLYIFDFEYAYELRKTYDGILKKRLRHHHGPCLKHALYEWADAFQCVHDLWKRSSHRIIRDFMAGTTSLVRFFTLFMLGTSRLLRLVHLRRVD